MASIAKPYALEQLAADLGLSTRGLAAQLSTLPADVEEVAGGRTVRRWFLPI